MLWKVIHCTGYDEYIIVDSSRAISDSFQSLVDRVSYEAKTRPGNRLLNDISGVVNLVEGEGKRVSG